MCPAKPFSKRRVLDLYERRHEPHEFVSMPIQSPTDGRELNRLLLKRAV